MIRSQQPSRNGDSPLTPLSESSAALDESFMLVNGTPSPAVHRVVQQAEQKSPESLVLQNHAGPELVYQPVPAPPSPSLPEFSESPGNESPPGNPSLSPDTLFRLEESIRSIHQSNHLSRTPRDLESANASPLLAPLVIHANNRQIEDAPAKNIFEEANAIRRAFYSVY